LVVLAGPLATKNLTEANKFKSFKKGVDHIKLFCKHAHIHMHTYTCTHTYIPVHLHTIHIRIKHTYMRTHARTHTHTHAYTFYTRAYNDVHDT
jgi:hypothetical protein